MDEPKLESNNQEWNDGDYIDQGRSDWTRSFFSRGFILARFSRFWVLKNSKHRIRNQEKILDWTFDNGMETSANAADTINLCLVTFLKMFLVQTNLGVCKYSFMSKSPFI